MLKTALLAAGAWAGLSSVAIAAAPLAETEPTVIAPEDRAGEDAIRRLLEEAGYGPRSLDALVEVRRHESPNVERTYLQFEQRMNGVPVHGSFVRVALEEDGAISRLSYRLADLERAFVRAAGAISDRALGRAVGDIFGRSAADVAAKHRDRLVFEHDAFYEQEPTADPVIIADSDGTVETGYLVEAWAKETNELKHALVDGRGAVIDVQNRTANDSYIAYKTSPEHGNPTVMGGWLADKNASPRGWLNTAQAQYDNSIRGHNVHAYTDTSRSNSPDGGGSRVWSGVFGVVPDIQRDALHSTNQRAAVQSLFYHVNDIHDKLYKYGFTESAGNFQASNYGRGGIGGDYVRAEALDGTGSNNANFATPLWDGGAPRMQMYKWNWTSPSRPGSFDADVIWHEYSHGLTWRMVGDMDGPVSGAIGEGMSDGIAAIMTDDDTIGEWAANSATGIRRHRYKGYPLTLKDFSGFSQHRDGEIYAAAIWRTWELFKANGKSRDLLMTYLVDGLNNTVPGPDYMQMRDGLLAASQGADDCLIWKAFAQFGMGQGASMRMSGSWPVISESRSVPSTCSGAQKVSAPQTTSSSPSFPQEGVWYALKNVATGRFVDTDSGGNVDQHLYKNGDDRWWRFKAVGDGTWRIINGRPGRGQLDTNGSGEMRWVWPTDSNDDDKRWRIETLADGSVRFTNAHKSRYFLSTRGVREIVWDTSGWDDNSKWVPVKIK
ncbi:M36 family metallopeptidase [Parvularcula oceani]|uniref:M36 family metallopeptidase n=1 Tax=Parvularcula oceani TaxID=1247963 RepID=UPI0004E11C2A|nr:M36 family metallopeptidase [Parvularcula oceani]